LGSKQFIFFSRCEIANASYYSQHKQDKVINEALLQGKQNSVFVEIGAYDGIKYSNTKFFEYELNWRGICIEPNPDQLKIL